jgi:hypothetical protein
MPSTRTLLLTPYPPFPLPSSGASSVAGSDSSDIPVEPEPLLSKLTPHTSHPDIIRRGGCLGAIKNIALDRGCHAFLLAGEGDRVSLERTGAGAISGASTMAADGENAGTGQIVRGVDVLPAVLGPLMGGEEYDMEVSTEAYWGMS